MGAAEEPVHLAGATLGKHRHICAFFDNAAEGYRVLLPFIKEGLARGDEPITPSIPTWLQHHRQLRARRVSMWQRCRRAANSSCITG
jgi:hypothetical protein